MLDDGSASGYLVITDSELSGRDQEVDEILDSRVSVRRKGVVSGVRT